MISDGVLYLVLCQVGAAINERCFMGICMSLCMFWEREGQR